MAELFDPMLPLTYRVVERQKENSDTFTLVLAPANGALSTAFAPGQFNMLYVFGVGEIPISISGDPAVATPVIHTTRAVGNVTRAMNGLRPGDTLGVRGPFGTAWPIAQANGHDVVIVCGGIGLAPLRPALYALLAHRERYGKIVLLYGARTQEDMLYRHELEQWRARFDLEVYVTVDRATGRWHGNVGVVTALIPRAPFDPAQTLAMVCGPEVMMRFTVQALERRGVAAERIYLSLERNMQCATGYCGHCQFGPKFICKDGPVFRYDTIASFFGKQEV
ncbi:MAG TPA: FAD/NAD(P)-binding protein [Caldilineaceae bacterium]|nr:FAD/NAD(P)-binding protein [Caldilineaceae bacterium]